MNSAKVIPLKPKHVGTVSIETDIGQYEELSFYLASGILSSEVGHHIHNLDTEEELEYHVRNAVESTLRNSCGMGGSIFIHNMPRAWEPLLKEIIEELEEL